MQRAFTNWTISVDIISYTALGVAVPVTKKKRIEEVKLALQEQMAKDSPDEPVDEALDVGEIRAQEPL